MYLKSIAIHNFRKLEKAECDFNPGLNLIVGPNDSGKTAIIDAIRFVLKQIVDDYSRITEDDFNDSDKEIHIEIVFSFNDCKEEELIEESSFFAEYLGFNSNGEPELKIWYNVKSNEIDIKFPSFRVGPSQDNAVEMDSRCRENLKAVYLRPLRDAENELKARPGSRISKILNKHEDIIRNEDELIEYLENFKIASEDFFKTGNGKDIKKEIDRLLREFDEQGDAGRKEIIFGPTEKLNVLKTLEKLALYYSNIPRPGLGTLNMIFISAELLHLSSQKVPKLLLVEEIEAHLHPQRQLKIIKALQEESRKGIQMILTTHSPNLSSVIEIGRLSICHKGLIYSLAENKTELTSENYSYLGRFLDVTKANLFFTQGVILVEGPTEQLIIPELAKILTESSLIDYGISIVSTNNLGFDHFVNIFKRKTTPYNPISVAVVTDADSRGSKRISGYIQKIKDEKNNIDCFVGPQLFADTSKESSTFEKIILGKTVLLKQLYIDAYNKLKKRKNSELKADTDTKILYSRIKNIKAPVAQEVAQELAILDSKRRDAIKIEINKELKYIADAIRFVTPRQTNPDSKVEE